MYHWTCFEAFLVCVGVGVIGSGCVGVGGGCVWECVGVCGGCVWGVCGVCVCVCGLQGHSVNYANIYINLSFQHLAHLVEHTAEIIDHISKHLPVEGELYLETFGIGTCLNSQRIFPETKSTEVIVLGGFHFKKSVFTCIY